MTLLYVENYICPSLNLLQHFLQTKVKNTELEWGLVLSDKFVKTA